MVALHHRPPASKRPSSTSISPLPPTKVPKSSTGAATSAASALKKSRRDLSGAAEGSDATDVMASVLADAGCTLINPAGPPCLPPDPHKFRRHLHHVFSSSEGGESTTLRSQFLSDLSAYIRAPRNLHRVLIPSSRDALNPRSAQGASLVRLLLLVPSIQLDIQVMLLEKLPEFFDVNLESRGTMPFLSDIATLILRQFQWLDFLVDANVFTEKLLELLSISPLHLRKEIIGSLPEILGDQNPKILVDALDQTLQEDSSVVVPVLDSLSNLNLDDQLQEQAITIAISCLRTIDEEEMPYLLRFLLLSASSKNIRRIISRVRGQLKYFGVSNSHAMHQRKLKGKLPVDNSEAWILDSLRSSLRYKNILSEETLKELKSLENPLDHRVIDIWLLVLIHMNGGLLQKNVEKILRKKVIDGCVQECLFDQCIEGNKSLVQDYFPSFISLSAYLLTRKEEKARDFGTHMYARLFEKIVSTYTRQEVLGALITHVGSGVNLEVSSALETMTMLASKYSQEMVRLSSHVNGILDYLDGFSIENLCRVYEVFSNLVLWARSTADSIGSSIANEVFMILRKQISNPNIKYKKMGLFGTLKIVSFLGDVSNATSLPSFQKSNSDEALELLETCLECCKQLPLLSVLFYDELVPVLESRTLHPTMMEWIGRHVGQFESVFLSDLESGQLPSKVSYCDLDGELWMNLDGDISPICLNILPLASSISQLSLSIQVLPAYFCLLSVIERLSNEGSLGGIDALLGCPLHLPSSKYYSDSGWHMLATKQKQTACFSVYYAINWIRELLNAFCTQVTSQHTSQFSKDELRIKLLKRLRNLVFLESLLNNFLGGYPLSLPEVHLHAGLSGSSILNQPHCIGSGRKRNERKKTSENKSLKKKQKHANISRSSNSDVTGKFRQPTIIDVFRKVGSVASQDAPNGDNCSGPSSNYKTPESAVPHTCDHSLAASVEVSAVAKFLDVQRFKFRPLSLDCLIILTFSKTADTCCSDPAAELPLHLYLLRDFHKKLETFDSASKRCATGSSSAPPGLRKMTDNGIFSKLVPIFPSLRKHLNAALLVFEEGAETCKDHWKVHSASAGNPDIPEVVLSRSLVSILISKEILCCFSKMLNIHGVLMNKAILSDLLKAFQPLKRTATFFSGMQPVPASETGGYLYLYCSAYSFLEEILDLVSSFSFGLAAEVLSVLESLISSARKFFDKSLEEIGKNTPSKFHQEILPILHRRLGTSAHKLLLLDCTDSVDNGLKNKGEVVQGILRVYLKYNESTPDLLDKLACSVLPQMSSPRITANEENHGFPSLSSATFVVWYRSLHEENLLTLNKLVKEVSLSDPRDGENVEGVVNKLQKSVNVVVSLVNMCRTHHRVTVRAMAVKYCGKFMDSFLKVFDYLQYNFERNNDLIIQLVKELQKATRTVQWLCSEAKGLRQTVITRKVPVTKRSMERFLFRVKALVHTTASGRTFWMGNLKHKDLRGQVVSSQAYGDEVGAEGSPVSIAGEEDG